MYLLKNFTIRIVMLAILGLFACSGRAWVYSVFMLYQKYQKATILTVILSNR